MIAYDDLETEMKRLNARIDRLECLVQMAIAAMIRIAEAVDVLNDEDGQVPGRDARRSRFS